MLPRRDSWVANYETVEELDVPFLSAPSPLPGREGLEERPQEHRSERVPDTSSSPLPLPSTTSYPPQSPSPPLPSSPFRPGSRPTSAFITRIPSEECRALSTPTSGLSPATSMLSGLTNNNGGGNRGSMILYRLEDVSSLGSGGLLPPTAPHLANRASVYSTSGDSFVSISSDSKYPLGLAAAEHGVIAYAWDPLDDDDDDDAPDSLYSSHPDSKSPIKERKDFSYRGLTNISGLVILFGAIIALFVVYPVVSFYHNDGVETKITMNSRINATGQAESSSFDLREFEGARVVRRGQRVFDSTSSAPMDAIDPTTPLDAPASR
ncbi:hypothetical protein BDQ12DRAFT_262827 [Crucibulum laeve]|uniref:Uncharacterized protein n=1 Tax=Crucibulum laeve TaxID=68775 RepID=A0A5C3LT97_9AGAR|nr:hypothetical protein BDQ12DRAFT_262827 [Crucibulum laeve]